MTKLTLKTAKGVTVRPASKLTGCYIKPREGDNQAVMFTEIDGLVIANLDRYAIVPLETYDAMVDRLIKPKA